MSERLKLVELALVPGANPSLLARRFGVTHQTVHKWVARYRMAGVAGLAERSRRPRASPAKVSAEMETAVVALRARHPAWGGRKLAARLRAMCVAGVPAASTVTAVLRRHGLLDPAESAKRGSGQRFEKPAANDLRQMDCKRHVPLGGGAAVPAAGLAGRRRRPGVS